MRTKGSKNIKRFGELTTIPTSATANVKHLASIAGNPLEQFIGILNHQGNFLNWIEDRHEKIVELKNEVHTLKNTIKGKGPTGAKEATFVKYRWYADHLVLLEAINAFETFYKTTFTRLGAILQPFVHPSPDRIVKINAQQLWGVTGDTVTSGLVPALVFEHELFHDLDNVDGATDMLIGKRRYNRKMTHNPEANRVKTLRGIFQVRHTLSHNCGLVTNNDHGKFKELGLTTVVGEVIDPVKGSLSLGILKELENEATNFTAWLRIEVAAYLSTCISTRSLVVPIAKKLELERLLGTAPCWASVSWT